MIRRALALAVTATALAGLVGALRQVIEARAVARGELERAAAATAVPPGRGYGPLGRRLATWVPARPTTPAGRLLAAIWAAPLTLVGFALSGLAGGRPRWDDHLGCWVMRGARGPSRVALRTVGATANTVGQVVLAIQEHPSPTLLAHEAVHVRQGERLGILIFPIYVWLGARYGYRNHPLERAARQGAAASITTRPDAPDAGDAARPA